MIKALSRKYETELKSIDEQIRKAAENGSSTVTCECDDGNGRYIAKVLVKYGFQVQVGNCLRNIDGELKAVNDLIIYWA